MITVDVLLDADNVLKHLTVKGHSGYANKGSDIVCASVSCLVQTSYIAVKRMLGNGVCLVRNLNNKDNNVFEYEIINCPSHLKDVIIGMTTFLMTGLFEINKQYEENVKINVKQ